jgi:hypothetical protein
MTGMCHQTQIFLIDLDGISWTFCPGCPWTMILPISACQIARITGVSHCVWPYLLLRLDIVFMVGRHLFLGFEIHHLCFSAF